MSPKSRPNKEAQADGGERSPSASSSQHNAWPAEGPSEPLAVVAAALRSVESANLAFPNYRLTTLVASRLDMDDIDIDRLAVILNIDFLGPYASAPRPFDRHLRHVIATHSLGALFSADGPGPHHHAIRPRAYDFGEGEVIALEMERWRADYRALPTHSQMLAASIVWLYRGGADNCWLRRVPCIWHAADALKNMSDAGVLEDWARLFALYPGW